MFNTLHKATFIYSYHISVGVCTAVYGVWTYSEQSSQQKPLFSSVNWSMLQSGGEIGDFLDMGNKSSTLPPCTDTGTGIEDKPARNK